MESFARLRKRIRKWVAGGVTFGQIAKKLRIHEIEVREIARHGRRPEWNPPPEVIAEECARIRAGWTDADWKAAATLMR
jgi:hypothetical protein